VPRATLPLTKGVVMVVLSTAGAHAKDPQRPATPEIAVNSASPRVRTDHPVLATLLRGGLARSATFRRLVGAIQATDGLVYVEQGRCGHGVRSCLPFWVRVAGPNRVLRVVVERLEPPGRTIGDIAHELQHALEVLNERSIASGSAMYLFYKSHGSMRGEAFETEAAIEAGNAVYMELRKRAR
jgi:hypothetical protein